MSDRVKKTKRKTNGKGLVHSMKIESTNSSKAALSLLADNRSVLDPVLSSLFAVKEPPVKVKQVASLERSRASHESSNDQNHEVSNDAELSEAEEELDIDDEDHIAKAREDRQVNLLAVAEESVDENEETKSKRKRKRKDRDEDLEAAYMSRLAIEETKEAARLAAERVSKRQRLEEKDGSKQGHTESDEEADNQLSNGDDSTIEAEENADIESSPPKHETEQQTNEELAKANRTVFLGNVSTAAITSKASRKTLLNYLGSFFDQVKPSEGSKPAVESLRFRSTPYATAMPKKAAFAKKELMDATTKSTNAYAVYSSHSLTREAVKRLNGTVVLGRHLRVDEVAHPAKIDHRRCVFVGNLGFVDDESNIQEANEEEGREKRKRGKEPADVEEGLWRTFGKCGKVESVRVIRDSKTRVGKGIAYVQFADENGVEAALLLNEKKFPPMLPRKLRVSRAKAQKRNTKPGTDRPTVSTPNLGRYQRKITGEEASRIGRTGKLLGRAAASQVQKTRKARSAQAETPALVDGIKKPESFVFEGHRASARQGKSGLKLAGKHGKKTTRMTKRSQSFKAHNKKKSV